MDRQHNAHTKRKIHVEETLDGLVITNTVEIEPINKTVSIIAALGLLITLIIQFQIIKVITEIDDAPTFVYVFLGLILVFLLYCQKIVLGLALFSILNKEIIECSNQQITVRKKWELSTKKSYNTSKIYKTEFDKPIYKGLFMQKYKSNYYKPLHKNISFRYGLEIMTFGVDVSESEANYILNTLVEKGILKQEQVKI
jgi:hypothetical protein